MWKRPFAIVGGGGARAGAPAHRRMAVTFCSPRTITTTTTVVGSWNTQQLLLRCHRPSITSTIPPAIFAIATTNYYGSSSRFTRLASPLASTDTSASDIGMLRRYASTIATDANNEDDCENVETTTSASSASASASAGATNNNASLGDNGYLGKILNAKVYDVAVETELQHAENLSQVSIV